MTKPRKSAPVCLSTAGIRAFVADEAGLVTSDWIVLTGAIMGGALGAMVAVRAGVDALALDIEGSLTSASLVALGSLTGEPIVPTAGPVMRSTAWNSFCPGNYSQRCQFWNRDIAMSDGTTWRVMETYFPNGTKTETWFDQDNNVVDAPVRG